MAGIMIRIEHPDPAKFANFPGDETVLAIVEILTLEELNYVIESRVEGRKYIYKKLKESDVYHYLSSRRKSIIEADNTKSNDALSDFKLVRLWWKLW